MADPDWPWLSVAAPAVARCHMVYVYGGSGRSEHSIKKIWIWGDKNGGPLVEMADAGWPWPFSNVSLGMCVLGVGALKILFNTIRCVVNIACSWLVVSDAAFPWLLPAVLKSVCVWGGGRLYEIQKKYSDNINIGINNYTGSTHICTRFIFVFFEVF